MAVIPSLKGRLTYRYREQARYHREPAGNKKPRCFRNGVSGASLSA